MFWVTQRLCNEVYWEQFAVAVEDVEVESFLYLPEGVDLSYKDLMECFINHLHMATSKVAANLHGDVDL